MVRKITLFICCAFLAMSLYGCLAIFAAGAGGAGTAVWLSGKLTQEVDAPYDRTVEAAKSALKSLRLEVTKETKEEKVAQIMSKYTDGKTIWIDVRYITDSRSKVEVRVGAVKGDQPAADKILKRMKRYL